MNQTNTLTIWFFCHLDIGVLVIVSDFVLRISNFLTEKTEFSVKHELPTPFGIAGFPTLDPTTVRRRPD